MEKFGETVPFDPGYSKISFSFISNIEQIIREFNSLKTMQQKKFKLLRTEPKITDMLEKSVAFYLGCLLWGAFLKSRFKNEPKEISGNYTLALSMQEQFELDCAQETKFMLAFIEQFKRDCKYYLSKPARIPDFWVEILNAYDEFAVINNNFTSTKTTDDIKLPKLTEHFENLSETQLDEVCAKIEDIISSAKIERLFEIDIFK